MPDPQLTEKELQALLRLKRYEQPAPAYFDGLLKNVHRQQQVDRTAAGEEPPLTESQLQALLHIKRYEQPPPAYFDGLLSSIHRRQRDELLRRPIWQVMIERASAAVGSVFRDWSYVGTMAGVLMIGLGVIQWVLPSRNPQPSPGLATAAPAINHNGSLVALDNPGDDDKIFKLPSKGLQPVKIKKLEPRETELRPPAPTRFIIDALPASYEAQQIRF